MADLDSPDNYHDRWMDDEFIEAFEDFQSLQTLTASLIFRILNTRYELEGRLQAEEDLPPMDAFRLRHADEVLIALQKIKDDTDTLIIDFNRPTKTFFEANLDQSRLIARLSMLLAKIQPFLPAALSEDHPAWAGYLHDRLKVSKNDLIKASKEDSVKGQDELESHTEERPRARVGGVALRGEHDGAVGAACFDREPRSRSVLPSSHSFVERELRWAAPMSL